MSVVDVHQLKLKRERQQQSLMPSTGDNDYEDDGTRYIDVELNNSGKGHNHMDREALPTPILLAASDDEEYYNNETDTITTTSKTMLNHHHPTRRRTCLYLVSAMPLIVSSLALGAVSLSSWGSRSETDNTKSRHGHDSSGATSALGEITPAATVPTSIGSSLGIASPPPSSPTSFYPSSVSLTDSEEVHGNLRPTSLPSSSISPTISPTIETSIPTPLPSSSTSPSLLPSSTHEPSSFSESTCRTTDEICVDDKMCCSRRCVKNKQVVVEQGGGGGGGGREGGKTDGKEMKPVVEKEKEPVDVKDKVVDDGPKERRKMMMERVCM